MAAGKRMLVKSFKIKCANLVIEIGYKLEHTKKHCKEYIVDDELLADFSVVPTESDYEYIKGYIPEETDEEIELVTILYLLADRIIRFDSYIMHGAALCIDGKGVIFSAPSGTGKTTQMRLWQKAFGERVLPVNGDKPIISRGSDEVLVSGSPFCGKEGYSSNITVPLKAICFIERAAENSIVRLKADEILKRIFHQLFVPRIGSEMMDKALDFVGVLIEKVDIYLLKCNMDVDAALTAYNDIFKKDLQR